MEMSYIPNKAKLSNFQETEDKFFLEDYVGIKNQDEIYEQLDSYFSAASIEDLLFYRNTYWKLYVYCTWDSLNKLTEEEFLVVVEKQIPDALSMGIDVWEKIIWYLGLRPGYPLDVGTKYEKIKNSFFNSQMVFGLDGKDKVKISKIINDIVLLDRQGNDSLEVADFLTKIEKIISDNKINSKHFYGTPTEAARNFLDLVHFFIGVDASGIEYVINSALWPDVDLALTLGGGLGVVPTEETEGVSTEEASEKKEDAGLAENKTPESAPSAVSNIEPKRDVITEKSFVEELSEHKNDFKEWTKHAETLRKVLDWLKSFTDNKKARQELKIILEKTLGSKSLEDTDNIFALARLDEFLIKNNYGGDDLIHYDEDSDSFKWGK